ncbi:MAG: RraA family protein [Tranquillimonas sp.]
MLENPPIMTVCRRLPRPGEAQIAAFRGMPTSFVADAMDGVGALAAGIGPIGFGRDLDCVAVGPALTADNAPGDVLATLAAAELLRPGDVVVAAVQGFQGCAAAGDRVMGVLKNAGAAGFVTDGPMRDYDGIVAAGLPAWCTGLTPNSPAITGPGRVGFPVQVGGRPVATGDMIVADRDGVVVVPFAMIDTVADRLARVREAELALDAEIGGGLKSFAAAAELLASDRCRYTD